MFKALLLVLLITSAFAQTNDLPTPPPVGPNGPFVVAVTSKGDWTASDTYTVNNMVTHSGDRYVSMADKNQGNEPTPVSSLWLRLPAYTGTVALASWGTTAAPGGKGAVTMTGKHFKSATSYGCELTSDLLALPSANPPALDATGKPLAPAPKAKFTNTSGEAFSISGVLVSPAGYVCAGS